MVKADDKGKAALVRAMAQRKSGIVLRDMGKCEDSASVLKVREGQRM